MENRVDFRVWGRMALFTDPLTRMGGEKFTYHLPTYEAMKGVAKSVYWKPTLTWYIDRVRLMNKIRTESKSMKPLDFGGGNSLAIYTYLIDVDYQVQAHFEWNLNYPELAHDRIDGKHYAMANRMVGKGGRRDVFLGTRECQAYVEPCTFGESNGFYDEDEDEISYGFMFHGFDYPDETGEESLSARFWEATISKGIIAYPPPETCTKHIVRPMRMDKPSLAVTVEQELETEGIQA